MKRFPAWVHKRRPNAEADRVIEAIGELYLFIKLSHWLPLVGGPQASLANETILKGLIWLCSKSEDPAIACALAELALISYPKIPEQARDPLRSAMSVSGPPAELRGSAAVPFPQAECD